MELENIIKIMHSDDKTQIIYILSNLDDVFESYNMNITDFDEIVEFLIDEFLLSKDKMIAHEILNVIVKSGDNGRNIGNINFSKIADNLNKIDREFKADCIRILTYTYDQKFLDVILSYKDDEDKYIRESVEDALVELNYSTNFMIE